MTLKEESILKMDKLQQHVGKFIQESWPDVDKLPAPCQLSPACQLQGSTRYGNEVLHLSVGKSTRMIYNKHVDEYIMFHDSVPLKERFKINSVVLYCTSTQKREGIPISFR